MKFSIVSIVGRSGAGKGTQAKLLQKRTGFRLIRTGDLLRKRAQKNDAVGKTVKQALDHGGLIPTPVVFSLWMPLLEKIKGEGKARGIIFDGNPRKLYEAHMLEEVFEMFGWKDKFRACYINVSEKEIMTRLLKRVRGDDTEEAVKGRLAYFSREVKPMLSYYRKKKALIEVDGEQSTENVHKEVMRKLRRFLK